MQTELEKMLNLPEIKWSTMQFDGGTSCNIPRLGYGKGYGSFRIDNQEIVRCEFENMSANAAEINTLASGLEEAARQGIKFLTVKGDSKIALKWVRCRKEPKEATSEMFRLSIERLRAITPLFGRIQTHWISRVHNVRVFGH